MLEASKIIRSNNYGRYPNNSSSARDEGGLISTIANNSESAGYRKDFWMLDTKNRHTFEILVYNTIVVTASGKVWDDGRFRFSSYHL